MAASAPACYTKPLGPQPEAAILRALRNATRPLRHALLHRMILGLGLLVRWLPPGPARGLGRAVGGFAYAVLPTERGRSQEHLALAFPQQDAAWRRRTARAVFRNLGLSAVDFLRLGTQSPEELEGMVAEVRGLEYLESANRRGQGSLVVTPHFGHWELLAIWTGLRLPVAAVARTLFDERIDQALNRRRAYRGLKVFPRETSVLPILRWLKNGGIVGVLADQDSGIDSLYCDFFGRPAKTPCGGVLLAQAAQAQLLTGYCWRQEDGRYVIEFEAPIPVPGRGERDPMEAWPAAQEYTRRIEARIRRHPEQWVWMHRRWKSPMEQDSTGWRSRLAPACRERMAAWVAAGRPELKA